MVGNLTRITIAETDSTLTVCNPARRRPIELTILTIFFFLFLICFFILPFAIVASDSARDGLAIAALLVIIAIVEIITFTKLSWMYFGIEYLDITMDEIYTFESSWPFKSEDRASVQSISSIKILKHTYPENYITAGEGGLDLSGVILFDTGHQTLSFGTELDRDEAEAVVAAVLRHIRARGINLGGV